MELDDELDALLSLSIVDLLIFLFKDIVLPAEDNILSYSRTSRAIKYYYLEFNS